MCVCCAVDVFSSATSARGFSLCLKNVKMLDVSSSGLIPSCFCAASEIICVSYLLFCVSLCMRGCDALVCNMKWSYCGHWHVRRWMWWLKRNRDELIHQQENNHGCRVFPGGSDTLTLIFPSSEKISRYKDIPASENQVEMGSYWGHSLFLGWTLSGLRFSSKHKPQCQLCISFIASLDFIYTFSLKVINWYQCFHISFNFKYQVELQFCNPVIFLSAWFKTTR